MKTVMVQIYGKRTCVESAAFRLRVPRSHFEEQVRSRYPGTAGRTALTVPLLCGQETNDQFCRAPTSCQCPKASYTLAGCRW
jgi:hypothetical protein